jgi:hypothetical protein
LLSSGKFVWAASSRKGEIILNVDSVRDSVRPEDRHRETRGVEKGASPTDYYFHVSFGWVLIG